jgi:predicted site-specific integrase-resolvase
VVHTWGLRSSGSPEPRPGTIARWILKGPGVGTYKEAAGTWESGLPEPVARDQINNPMEPETKPFPSGELMYKKEAAKFLGVSLKTLEGYVARGAIDKWKNTINGRTYYDREQLLKLLGSRLPQAREVWVYCRAAGIPDQGSAGVLASARLQTQVDRVLEYCTRAGIRVDRVIQEVGKAGSLAGRSGLDKIFEAVLRKQLSMVIVETPDRLARFTGSEILERFLTWHGVEYHVIQNHLHLEEYREELKNDLTYLILESRKLIGEL